MSQGISSFSSICCEGASGEAVATGYVDDVPHPNVLRLDIHEDSVS